MTKTNRTTNSKAKPSTANTIKVIEEEGESKEHQIARLGLSPTVAAAVTATKFAKGAVGEMDLTETVAVVRDRVRKVKEGDLSDVEATLTAQAMTLDSIFHEMAKRAALNMGQHMAATESYLKMALKAQSQCRATLETLVEVKAPRSATFIKQANIANQQQVNNGQDDSRTSTRTGAHAHGKNINQRNELLEAQHGERVDTRAQSKAGGANTHLEAVGVLNGA